jgi:hypothetical protein
MSPEQAIALADEIIADVARGSPVARQLIAARLMLVRAEGERDGMIEARATADRALTRSEPHAH